MRHLRLTLSLALALGACGRFGFDSDRAGADGDGDIVGGDDAPVDGTADGGTGDDGLPPGDASTDAAERRANLAFVTAATYTGDLGGVAGADALCAAEAAAAGREGDFVALLWSSDRPDPGALLASSSGWVRADGRWLAETAAQVIVGDLDNLFALSAGGDNLLDVDSGGPPNRVWNGLGEGNCSNWTASTGQGDQTWIPQWRRISDGQLDCSLAIRLACFERGRTAPRPAMPITRKRVFVTSADFAMSGGVAAADALCDAEAAANGLGASRALIGTTTTAGIDRIPGARATRYQRVDGVDVGLLTAPETWLNVDAAGVAQTANVWTGGVAIDTIPTDTCLDWTSTAGSSIQGQSWDFGAEFTCGVASACSDAARLYCVEL